MSHKAISNMGQRGWVFNISQVYVIMARDACTPAVVF